MKLVSMFFTASAENLRALAQSINKRARNMKLVSMFFTASAENLRALAQSINKRARNTKLASVFFNISGLFKNYRDKSYIFRPFALSLLNTIII